MRTQELVILALVAGVGAAGSAAVAEDLLPVVVASIHDEPPDGQGDSFNDPPFEGLLRKQSTREDRAILEYDASGFAGAAVDNATIAGRVSVNNAFDNGPRTFDFLLYEGNGQADLTDFQIPGVVIGSGSYHPPNDSFFDFQFDVMAQLQALLDGGATFIGLKVVCASEPNFPNILSDETTLTIEAADCPPDLNGDTVVNTQDFTIFLNLWAAGDPQADWNGDTIVNSQDFVAFLNDWAAGCP